MTEPIGIDELRREFTEGRVPAVIRMTKTVHGDWPIWHSFFADVDMLYIAGVNPLGAVHAILENGHKLGLKPDEFQVVEWKER